MSEESLAQSRIRVYLVDDQILVRAGFRMVLDAQDDLVVVGEAGDGQAAVDALSSVGADVVLMDVRMPRLDGIAATRAVLARPHPPKVIVLTTFDLDEYVLDALRAGASGFLLKDAGPTDLLSAIHSVHAGDAVIAPSATRRLMTHFLATAPNAVSATATDDHAKAALRPLTTREVEILTLVGQGLTNGEIAAELFVAEATVKTHIGRVLHKLSLRDRVQMVLLAYDTGLVRPQR